MKIINYYELDNCPKEFPDKLLNEDWAKYIHSQSLKRLNERGGMSPFEIYMNIHKLTYRQLKDNNPDFNDEDALILIKSFLND